MSETWNRSDDPQVMFAALPRGGNKTGQTTATKWWPTEKGFRALGWTLDEQGQWVPPVEVDRG